jgi:transcriptional regulator
MYIPASNKIDDHQKAFALIESYGFATLVSQKDGIPWASHLPVLLDRKEASFGRLRSHMARANEQWQHFDPTKEVLVIFHGPHSYISPSWYASKIAVPTWNYATVHVYGLPRIEMDYDFLRRIVDDTTEKYERKMENPWKMELPENTIDTLMNAIIGFSIEITRIETKFKLGQNRSKEDQSGMLDSLAASASASAQELALFIKNQNHGA